MDKLKPYPFCGHEAMISYNSVYDFQAYCTNDSCFMSKIIMEDMESEEQARAAWNKRAPSVQPVPLDKLCEMLSKFVGNPPCPCGYDLKGTGCNPDWEGKDCWEIALTTWMEENK